MASVPPLTPEEAVLVSVILPVFNEAAGIAGLVQEVAEAMGEHRFEVLCVDDGSTDQTASVIHDLRESIPEVRLVQLSRNFGKEAAMLAGLDHAIGKAVVLMDADHQHPPALLPKMITLWQQGGAEVVVARHQSPVSQGFLHQRLWRGYYALLRAATGKDLQGSSDFQLLDRAVVEAILAMPERNRFFRGMVAWAGFCTAEVPFEAPDRKTGQSTWSLPKLISYGFGNIVSFTTVPLYLTAWVGVITTAAGFLLGVESLFNWLRGAALEGFTTINIMVVTFSGMILSAIGVMAIYLAKIYDEVKGRPVYIIRNADSPQREDSGG